MHNFLTAVTADCTDVLVVKPQMVMPNPGRKNQIVHTFEDGRNAVVAVSDTSIFEVELQWAYVSDEDRATIFELFHNSAKANGSGRSFYWEHPVDGYVYTVRFLTPLRTIYKPGSLNSIEVVRLRIEGFGPTPVMLYGTLSACQTVSGIGDVAIGVSPQAVSAVSATPAIPGSMIRGIIISGESSVSSVSSAAGIFSAGVSLFGVSTIATVESMAGSIAAGVSASGVSSVSAASSTAGTRIIGLIMSGASSISFVSSAAGTLSAGDAIMADGVAAVVGVTSTAGVLINFNTYNLLTEEGDYIITETGDNIVTEEA